MWSTKFPYSIKSLNPQLNDKLKALFLGDTAGIVEIGPKKFKMPYKYGEAAEIIYNFEVKPDDVWIVTFPRSGTTLTQEMVWLILNNDYDMAANVMLTDRFPFLEFSTVISDDLIAEIKSEIGNDHEKLSIFLNMIKPQWEVLKNTPSRRFIKTHLPLSLLPPALVTSGAKIIYVARNPKNVAISYYNQSKQLRLSNFVGDFETYWDLFETGLVPRAPYWEHLEEGWWHRNDKNFLFMFYEDITRDYKKAIVKVSEFLDVTLNDEEISKLEEYLHIDEFRKNQQRITNIGDFFSVQGPYQHVRIGKSANWDEYFTKELNARANNWINEHYKSTTLRFPIKLD